MASSPTTSFPGSDDIPQSMPSTFQEAVLVSVSGSPNMVGESSVEGVSGPIPTDHTLECIKAVEPVDGIQSAFCVTLSNQDSSVSPSVDTDEQHISGCAKFRCYMANFCLECTAVGLNFAALDSIRLIIVGLSTYEILLKRNSPNKWKDTSIFALPANTENLTILAKSVESDDLARMILTRDELGLGQEAHEAPITKDFTCEVGIPPMKLTFVVAKISQERASGGGVESQLHQMALELAIRGNTLRRSFEQTRNLTDISEAISIQQQAVQLTPDDDPNLPRRLHNLGIALLRRFELTCGLPDLSEAISAEQQAVQLTSNENPLMPTMVNNLGILFQRRFEHVWNIADIEGAIAAQQHLVALTPDGHPNRPARLSNLGNSFLCRFEHTGDLVDISEAISVQQKAVDLTPNDHSNMPGLLNNLGNSFRYRFDITHDLPDISEAISLQQQAVQLTTDDDVDLPSWLNNLGTSFRLRFEHGGEPLDISEAISVQQRAVKHTTEGHNDAAGRLNNLGISLLCRFECKGDPADISKAISVQQQAVQLTPDGHAMLSARLINLGNSLACRFKRAYNLSDNVEAISAQIQAVQLTPNGHASLPAKLNNLADSFQCRFERSCDLADIHMAISTYKKSATSVGPPSVRLFAAQQWAKLSTIHERSQSMEAYGVVIDLISQIAGMDRTIEQRYINLVRISNLTTAAASAAFAVARVEKALEWLEQGRCLVWSQLNQLRTPVDDLRDYDGDLARRFLSISRALETSGSRRPFGSQTSTGTLMSQKMTLQDEAHVHVKLAREWNQLLVDIRRISRFRDFLRPRQTSDFMQHLPPDGHIILINVHESRCDALALDFGRDLPIHIPLKFTHKQASGLRDRLRNSLSSHGICIRDVDRGGYPASFDGVGETHSVLKALWVLVVRPILDGLGYSHHNAPSEITRIWWCPTGPLAFLPLHAAGIYNQSELPPSASCISDFAVSSYTPNVSALLEKVKGPADVLSPSTGKLLIISQPNSKDCSPLPGTTEEMDIIQKTVGLENCKPLESKAATVSKVKIEMQSHDSIHFACHANQNIGTPLKSGFYLDDGRLELAEIMKQNIPQCELAFLSACQTSTGDEELSEEAVHLAAGMLAVGYRGVVATLWSIKDEYGPVVAESFYKYLMENGRIAGKMRLNSTNAARALHHAIQSIRGRPEVGDTEKGLLTWVPYVHFGY